MDKKSGCVAGTLVHTEQGLVAIEQLKVGDKVLCKATHGNGELVYKAISKTMVTVNVPVFLIEFEPYVDPTLSISERINLRRALRKQLQPTPLFVTANHPFWTTNHGWLKAEQLTSQDPMLTKDDRKFVSRVGGGFDGKYKGIVPILQTDRKNFGYIVNYGDDTGQISGHFVDLKTGELDFYSPAYQPVIDKLWINDHKWKQRLLDQAPEEHRADAEFYGFRQGHWRDPETVVWGEGEGPLTMTVYNIEVDETQTYFVGEQGVWVHQ